MRNFRVFISSPGDAAIERLRAETVISRLNGEFAGAARIEGVRWETEHYRAHATFQTQIPPADTCDIVLGILRWRIGTALPPTFLDHLPGGEPYPSGTAYELLTAIDKRRRGAELPDVFVFRYAGGAPAPQLGRQDYEETVRQWQALRGFVERWFLTVDGHFEAAFNSYASEDDFERQVETLLRRWLAEKVAGGRVVAWPATRGSPFRALNAFDARHAPVFFGRGADIRKAIDLWRDPARARFLLIVGASGAGKSSLARAGLLPRIVTPGVVAKVDLWRTAVVRPSDSPDGPFAALAAALMRGAADVPPEEEGRGDALAEIAEGDSKSAAELAAVLAHADAGAVRTLTNALDRIAVARRESGKVGRAVRCDLVLLVDPLDELFASSLAVEVRARFAALLAVLVASGRVWIVATLRADLYAPMLEVPELKALKDGGASYDLAPPGAAELAEIVREPAQAAALIFDTDAKSGERLDERLLREADRPDMLPLVQLALSRLWEARETKGGETLLPLTAFDKLGGLNGIVAAAGEAALATLGNSERAALPSLIRRLAEVSPGSAGSGRLIARPVPRDEAASDATSHRLVEALVAARLLTLSADTGGTSIRLAHQRVLSDWPRAATIVSESADFYRIRDEVEAQRRRWEAGKRRGELLLVRGLPLAEARAMTTKYATELSEPTRAYVAASRRRAGRAQVLGWAVACVFAAVAVVAGVEAKIASDRRVEADRQRQIAADRHAEADRQRQIAERNFDAAKTTVAGLVFDIAQGLEDVPGMRVETIRKILDTARATVDRLLATAPEDSRLLLIQAGMLDNFAKTYKSAGDLDAALAAASESLAVIRKLAALQPESRQAQRNVAAMLSNIGYLRHQSGDSAGALAAAEEGVKIARALDARDSANAEPRLLSVSLAKLGAEKMRAGDRGGALAAFEESLAIQRKLATQEPRNKRVRSDLAAILNNIGDVRLRGGDGTRARADYTEGYNIALELVTQDPENAEALRYLSDSLDNIGKIKREADDDAGALAAYQESLEMVRKLAALDRGNVAAQRDVAASLEKVGDVKLEMGDQAGALAAYQESLDIQRKYVAQNPGNPQARRDLSVSLSRVGDVKLMANDLAGARKDYQASLDIDRQSVARDGSNIQARRDLLATLRKFGLLEMRANNGIAALAAYRESLEIARALAARDSGDVEAQRAPFVILNLIGGVKLEANDLAGARAAYLESLEIARKAAAREPGSAADLSAVLAKFGALAMRAGDLAGAAAAYRESLDIDRKRVAQEPKNAEARRDLSGSLNHMGDLRLRSADQAGALAAYQEAVNIAKALVARNKGDVDAQRQVATSLEKIGNAKLEANDLTGARAPYQEALAIRRRLAEQNADDPDAQWDLIASLTDVAMVSADAPALDREILAIGEKMARAGKLSPVRKGVLDRFKTALEVDQRRDRAIGLEKIGITKLNAGDAAGALVAYEDELAIFRELAKRDPASPKAWRDVAIALHKIGDAKVRTGDLAGALAANQEAFDIARKRQDPSDTWWLDDMALSLGGIGDAKLKTGDTVGALASYQDELAIRRQLATRDPSDAETIRNVAIVLDMIGDVKSRLGDHAGALAAHQEALGIFRMLSQRDESKPEPRRDVAISLGKLADAKQKAGDLSGALGVNRERVAIARARLKASPDDQASTDLADVLGNAAYAALLAKDYPASLTFSDEAISLKPNKIWLQTNYAHASMFLHRTDEARALYLKHRGKIALGKTTWETVVKDDFTALRKLGITDPLMDEVDAAFAKSP